MVTSGGWKMKSLFIVVSILGVLPMVCRALSVPLQSSALAGSAPQGLLHRERRAENGRDCEQFEYKPSKKDYCCIKCHAGYKVKEHCKADGQASICVPCDSDTFAEVPNGSMYCESCSSCLLQTGQVVTARCSRTRDTQCGCEDGFYIERRGETFACRECSRCHNGTESVKCQGEQDTVCQCKHGLFFHQSERKCLPCDQCHNDDCKEFCPEPVPVQIPNNEHKHGLWLAVGAAIVAGVIAITGMGGIYCHYRRKTTSSSSDLSGSSTQHDPLIDSDVTVVTKHTHLPGQPISAVDNDYAAPRATEELQKTLPLPDITQQTAAPRLDSMEVMYVIIGCVPVRHWREFARRLGLSDHQIDTSDRDHRYYNEAQYAMLRLWLSREGSAADRRDQLFSVLREMNLGGCIERIEEHL